MRQSAVIGGYDAVLPRTVRRKNLTAPDRCRADNRQSARCPRGDRAGGMTVHSVPERTDAPEYFFKYIDLVPGGDIRAILQQQVAETLALLRGISEEQSQHQYAPDKWSVRQVVSHVNDTERVFAFRALWFARGFQSELPSFDQNIAARYAAADQPPLTHHVGDFEAVRSSTLALFRHLPADAWQRRGVVSNHEFTIGALAYIIAGHVAHHMNILRERYL